MNQTNDPNFMTKNEYNTLEPELHAITLLQVELEDSD